MSALPALLAAGFRHQASFRFAMVSGLLTNLFFGVVRSAVFLSVYRTQDEVGGLDVAAALTYVWILQAVFAVVWAPWLRELPTRIRSGEWTAELTRPGAILARHLAYDCGRAMAVLALRAPFPLALAAVAYHLRLPTTPGGIAALVISLCLALVAASCLRFLIGSVAFWSADHRGIHALLFGPLWLASGFVIPVEYFPDGLRQVAVASPLGAILRAPVAVATGREVGASLLSQCLWCVVFIGVCAAVLDRATRRMVAFGG